MFATRNGMVKKTAMSDYDKQPQRRHHRHQPQGGRRAHQRAPRQAGREGHPLLDDGKAIMFDESEVRAMGRDTSGVRGITLKDDATMLGMEITNGNGDLLVMTENGYGKRTPVSEYPEHKRGGQGVYTIAMTPRRASSWPAGRGPAA
jgi:DNA gyrase subunit A